MQIYIYIYIYIYIIYRPSPTQRMSSTAWICAVKWGADVRCDALPQMKNNLPDLALVERE